MSTPSCLYPHGERGSPRILTHLPLDKMAAILANDNFKCIFLNENDMISIWNSLKFVPRSPIDHNPLPELMLTQFTDAYMRH